MDIEDGTEPDDTCSNMEISDEKADDLFKAGRSLGGFCWDGVLVASPLERLSIWG